MCALHAKVQHEAMENLRGKYVGHLREVMSERELSGSNVENLSPAQRLKMLGITKKQVSRRGDVATRNFESVKEEVVYVY